MGKSDLLIISGIIIIAVLICGCTETPADSNKILHIATTTSLYDTGLLGHISPMFEEQYDADVRIVSAGTGKALEYGERGDVDVMMVHDRAREDLFIENGNGINRRVIAYNYFVIIGPESDPAGIKGMTPEDALKTIMEKGQTDKSVLFVSRGDSSGTHAKEKVIWKSAGYDYEDVQNSGEYYLEAGGGMGSTLVIANEKQAYTLSDIGTYLAFKGDLELVPLIEKGDILLNIYSAMQINPAKFSGINGTLAKDWINFLISEDIQNEIGNFGVEEYGQPLFNPSRGAWGIIGVTREECEEMIV